jgi:hypothetical protein
MFPERPASQRALRPATLTADRGTGEKNPAWSDFLNELRMIENENS